MHHGIVEGEPGIFPDPIARFMRGVGRFFDRKKRDEQPPPPTASTGEPDAEDTPQPPT
jgi:hypothetical protein